MIDYIPRTMINGALLRNFISQHVSVHVHVEEEAERQSKLIKGKTSDDVEVKVVLSEPLNVPLKGWIEVIGIPTGPDTIRNKEIILFSQEDNQPFDKSAHNSLIMFLNNCKEIIPAAEDVKF